MLMHSKQLTKGNIQAELRAYLSQVRKIRPVKQDGSIFLYLLKLKRGSLQRGPYPDVSMFEAANRILSDILIFYGVRRLLNKPSLDSVPLPFKKYSVNLGTSHGYDIEATSKRGYSLIGEAFNVAPDYFPVKMRKTEKKLLKAKANYRLILFNKEATHLRKYLMRPSNPNGIIYLPVKVPLY